MRHTVMSWHTVRGATTSSNLGGPVPWSRILLPFYRKKLERSTQFGPISYIITLFIKKLRENLGASKFWGSDPPTPSGCANAHRLHECRMNRKVLTWRTVLFVLLSARAVAWRCRDEEVRPISVQLSPWSPVRRSVTPVTRRSLPARFCHRATTSPSLLLWWTPSCCSRRPSAVASSSSSSSSSSTSLSSATSNTGRVLCGASLPELASRRRSE